MSGSARRQPAVAAAIASSVLVGPGMARSVANATQNSTGSVILAPPHPGARIQAGRRGFGKPQA